MAGNKYLTVNNTTGNAKEVEALQSSAGAADAGKIPSLGTDGRISETMMPTGVGADVTVLAASENLAAGDYVNIWNDAGTAKVRKADASTTKPADGFVKDAVTSGADATVYHEGGNDQHTGLTPGSRYFLSATTPGGVVLATSLPTASGSIVQFIGKATSDTTINIEAAAPIERA